MPNFRSWNEIASHVSKNSGQTVNQLNITSKIVEAAKELEAYMKEDIRDYYSSYSPKRYKRTNDWIESLRVSQPKVVGNTLQIAVYFDSSMAYHPSVISSSHPDGFVPWLMDKGWKWRSTKVKIDRFTEFGGIHYISNSVAKFNARNKYGFKISIELGNFGG